MRWLLHPAAVLTTAIATLGLASIATAPIASVVGAIVALLALRPLGRDMGWVSRLALVLCSALAVACAMHPWAGSSGGLPSRELQERLDRVLARASASVKDVTNLADRIAQNPDIAPADSMAQGRLFRALETERARTSAEVCLAVRQNGSPDLVAWSGRVPRSVEVDPLPAADGVFVQEGALSVSLVATRRARGGVTVVVQVPISLRRNIANEYLSDFDAWAASDAGVEISYIDANESSSSHDLPPLPEEVPRLVSMVRGPTGTPMALVRVTPHADRLSPREPSKARLALAVSLCVLAALAVAKIPLRGVASSFAWTAIAVALRLALAVVVPAAPGVASPLRSSDVYATSAESLLWLLGSPVDLALTAATLMLAAWAAGRALDSAASRRPTVALSVMGSALAIGLVGPLFALIGDVSRNSTADLSLFSAPLRLADRLLQLGCLTIVAGGIVLTVGLLRLGATGASDRRAPRAAPLFAALVGLVGLAWIAHRSPVPAVSAAIIFFLGGALAFWLGDALLWPERHVSSRRIAAIVFLALVATLALRPALVRFHERATERLVEEAYAPYVLQQPILRGTVLDDARRSVDLLGALTAARLAPHPPEIAELAFAVWSQTELATFGLSSAVEIQDASGVVTSRFALNLPAFGQRVQALPENVDWRVRGEVLRLGSVEQPVLHASRSFAVGGRPTGAVHLYVSEDYWNLPFLTPRDPYSLLYRPASLPASKRGEGLDLFVFNRGARLVFASTDRAPEAPFSVARGGSNAGAWTSVVVDGRPARAYVFADQTLTYVLTYARPGAARSFADLLDGVVAVLLFVGAILIALLTLRALAGRSRFTLATVARRIRGRFALRLLAAFVLLAVLPVGVLQVVARRFIRERLLRDTEAQALQRALVSQKAIEDFAFLQRREASATPVTDDAVTYVSSLLRTDLAVFEGGRLLAASKRELYSSGLLPPRIDESAYRALVLEGRPHLFGEEQIGDFSYRVLSLPVRISQPEPAILSMPLALRERDVQNVIGDLDRSIRLASLLFLATGAVLAYSMAWRFSGPLSDLTRAAQRIASGDLATRVEGRTEDEMASLVDAFNRMAADLEAQRRDLERSNRRAAWADMARQVAHEVKNPLTPIRLSAEHLRRVYKEAREDFPATLAACTATILQQVDKLRGIATEFSAFARPAGLDLVDLDLGALVRESLGPYLSSLPEGVQMDLVVADRLAPVRVERRLIERAFLNLVENALHAIGDKGTVAVVVSSPGPVTIDVTDTGPGIDPALKPRLFEPFFSTKTGGTGLGLVLARKIAEDHGGGCDIVNAVGEPTRIRLWLPRAPGAA